MKPANGGKYFEIIMKRISLLIIVLAVTTSTFALDTNEIYLPVDAQIPLGEMAKMRVHERQMELARKLPECRPAELDPEGHWGVISNGLQLSLRFSTNVFQAGRPIGTSVILRNTRTNTIVVSGPVSWSMEFSVLNQNQEPLATVPKITYFGGGNTELPARSQIKLGYELNDVVDLSSPGKYLVYVKMKKTNFPEIRSGNAEITIEPASK